MGTETVNGGTQVSRSEPPGYQLPYLREGLDHARQMYGQGPPQQYGGNTVVPFASQTERALGLQEQRALNGSPVTSAAQNYVTGSLNGSQFGGNPQLDNTFNRAAMATQGQLASQFAGSGRNVDQSQFLRGQQLNDLATSIYGGAYENDRNRQQATLSHAIPLAQQDYQDIAALRGVGGEVEAQSGQVIDDAVRRHDYNNAMPSQWLDQYLNRISGQQGQTTTTQLPPQYQNRTAGAAGGALAGYGLGGGWGALLGGLLGGYG
jgi:hypothetical protein